MKKSIMKTRLFLPAVLFTVLIGLQAQTTNVTLDLPIAPGPFVGTMDSLTNYSYPKWFRDAKFGIWAHWGPQAVPM
jgi:alpha-L-fucosidase